MTVNAIRLQNFMGFQDTGWVELRSINLLFGRNSTGKSAILRALLLLRQSLDSRPEEGPLTFVAEDGQDFGGFRQMVYGQRRDRNISFWFQCDFSTLTQVRDRLKSYLLDLAQKNIHDEILGSDTYRFRLIFSWDKHQKQTRLVGADLYHQRGNLILGATAPADPQKGTWTFRSDLFDPEQPDADETQIDELAIWSHARLVIDQGFLPRLEYPDSTEPEPPDNVPFKETRGVPKTVNTSLWFLREIRVNIRGFLRAIHYLGPLRAEPLRHYYVAGQPGNRVDAQGRHAVQTYLAGQRQKVNEDRLDQINRWLDDAGVGKRLVFKPVDRQKTLYEIELVESSDAQNLQPNLREVGFGVSQVLPVLIQAMLAPAGSTVLIEQPELHLHPAAQAELGDLFISAAQQGTRFLIETHSEHLLYRLQRRIAETSLGALRRERQENEPLEPRLHLNSEDLNVYFVSRTKFQSKMTAIIVDEWGRYVEQPDAFQTFFSNDLDELLALDDARLEAMQEETE
jgi:predicted ATPase